MKGVLSPFLAGTTLALRAEPARIFSQLQNGRLVCDGDAEATACQTSPPVATRPRRGSSPLVPAR
ncbi:MAG TPA: hypothetical protein VI136_25905, partial [Verrucomicrobiae bacterium]